MGDKICIILDLTEERSLRTYEWLGLSRREGVYLFLNHFFEPVYIGRSSDLAGRLDNHRYMLEPQMPDARFVVVKTCDNSVEIEKMLIELHNPKYNGQGLTTQGGYRLPKSIEDIFA